MYKKGQAGLLLAIPTFIWIIIAVILAIILGFTLFASFFLQANLLSLAGILILIGVGIAFIRGKLPEYKILITLVIIGIGLYLLPKLIDGLQSLTIASLGIG